jgi:hypothetical protein
MAEIYDQSSRAKEKYPTRFAAHEVPTLSGLLGSKDATALAPPATKQASGYQPQWE